MIKNQLRSHGKKDKNKISGGERKLTRLIIQFIHCITKWIDK